jgi:hypothetical protein
MGFETAPARSIHPKTILILSAVVLALVPSAFILHGLWLGDTLLFYLDQFYWIAALCMLGVVHLIWLARPARQDWLPRFSPQPAQQAEESHEQIVPLRSANAFILLSALGCVISLATALVLRRPPGVELFLCVLLYWLGWLLREELPEKMRAAWRIHRAWIPSFLLFFGAVLMGMAISNWTVDFPWLVWVLVALSGIPLWFKRSAVPFPVWAFLGGWLLYTFRLDHWLYSVVGDDYAFYTMARDVLKLPFRDIDSRFFDCCAVYGMHPFISTLLQSAWMAVFGSANFGWRGLNPFLCALALPFYFVFFRAFTSRWVAASTVALLASSSYLMDFLKIGYNNPQAFFGMGLLLAACVWALRQPGGAAYTGLGLAASLCLYIYPPALYALPVAGLVMLFYAPPLSRLRLAHWGLAGGLFLVFASLLFFNPNFIPMRLIGTFAWSDALRSSSGTLFNHTRDNLGMALLSGYYAPEESHFVVAGYQDPLSAALALVGLGLALTQVRRSRFLVLILLSFVLLLYLVGASHDRTTPSTTRMFLLLPWFSLFAAMALEWLTGFFKGGWLVKIGVLGLIVGLNFIQAYWLALERDNDSQSLEVLFVRLAQDMERKAPQAGRGYVFLTAGDHGIDGFYLFQDVYPQYLAQATLNSIFVDQQGLTGVKNLEVDAKHILIQTPYLSPPQVEEVWQTLNSAGWMSCSQMTYNGQLRFTVWYAADARYPAGPCSPILQTIPARIVWQLAVGLAVLGDVALVFWMRRRRLVQAVQKAG